MSLLSPQSAVGQTPGRIGRSRFIEVGDPEEERRRYTQCVELCDQAYNDAVDPCAINDQLQSDANASVEQRAQNLAILFFEAEVAYEDCIRRCRRIV
jgi:hypothetical protein